MSFFHQFLKEKLNKMDYLGVTLLKKDLKGKLKYEYKDHFYNLPFFLMILMVFLVI